MGLKFQPIETGETAEKKPINKFLGNPFQFGWFGILLGIFYIFLNFLNDSGSGSWGGVMLGLAFIVAGIFTRDRKKWATVLLFGLFGLLGILILINISR